MNVYAMGQVLERAGVQVLVNEHVGLERGRAVGDSNRGG